MQAQMLILRREKKAQKQFTQICHLANLFIKFIPQRERKKLIDITETNHSTNLIAQIQLGRPQCNFKGIVQHIDNLILSICAKILNQIQHPESALTTNPNCLYAKHTQMRTAHQNQAIQKHRQTPTQTFLT